MNKKGFVLMETLVVTIFTLFIFTVLYNSVVPLLGRYEELSYYDDLDTTYDLYYLRNFITNDPNYSNIKSNRYIKLTCDNLANKEGCNSLFEFLEIDSNDIIGTDEVIFLNTNYIDDLKNDVNISLDIKNYLKYKNINDNILLLQKDGYISYIGYYTLVDKFNDYIDKLNFNPILEEDSIRYLSGKKDDNDVSTSDDINFNYVWYSGKLWRITALYSDGSIKLVTDDVITSIGHGALNFYTSNSSSSFIYQWLNQDFLDTLYNHDEIVMTANWNATNSNENEINVKLAETDLINAKVGLLNSYEYYKSYEKLGDYSTGYLNSKNYWWLLNPYSSVNIWCVNNSGLGSSCERNGTYSYGVRPAIILNNGVQVSGGNGTKENPYTLLGDKSIPIYNTTFLNTRSSGEYVNFSGEKFRIVGIENNATKLITVENIFYGGRVLGKKFPTSLTYGSSTSDTYVDYYLNNAWFDTLDSAMLVKSTYYLKEITSIKNYKIAICQTYAATTLTSNCSKVNNTWNGYIGLPRYGEMFAYQNSGYMVHLITPGSSNNWVIDKNARLYTASLTGYFRPTITLASSVKIINGTGLPNNPYEVSL